MHGDGRLQRRRGVTNDQINCKKEYYRLSSTCGAPRNHTNVQPVDAQLSDDSYIYQLSLVSATATLSFLYLRVARVFGLKV